MCGRTGAPDEQWRGRTEQEVTQPKTGAALAKGAYAGAAKAQKKACERFLPVRVILTGAPAGAADPEPAVAWDAWGEPPQRGGPDGLRQPADHIERVYCRSAHRPDRAT